MNRTGLILFAMIALVASGCARTEVLVTPGRVTVPAFKEQMAGKWVFWIRSVADEREEADKSQPTRIGELGQRFDENKTVVYMDKAPDAYLKEQLSLYLLNQEMEASSSDKAKVFLDIALKKFRMGADATQFLDQLEFTIDYEIKFHNANGLFLGSVRFPEKRMIKDFTPLGAQKVTLETLILDTMTSTFTLLAQSDIYKAAAEPK